MFAPELPGLRRNDIRDWYNGYSWRGDQKVYNPFDILLLFDSREYKAHWFETGSPSFLIETLRKRRLGAPALEDMVGTEDLLSKFDVADYEGYYASVFYSWFAALGLDVTVEDSSSHGRLDMAVRFNGNVYLFEFKVVERASTGAALTQLKERGYADKYRHLDQPIHLVAVEFSREARNLASVEVERG